MLRYGSVDRVAVSCRVGTLRIIPPSRLHCLPIARLVGVGATPPEVMQPELARGLQQVGEMPASLGLVEVDGSICKRHGQVHSVLSADSVPRSVVICANGMPRRSTPASTESRIWPAEPGLHRWKGQ